MKTPREILLEQHRAAEPELDAIRQSAVAAVCDRRISADRADEQRSPTAAAMIWQIIWRELVWPCRWTWVGLTAVWVALCLFNVSQRDKSELAARKLPPPSAGAVMAWQQQQRLLTELIGANESHSALPPKPVFPQPRSEVRDAILVT